jgi:predicted nucleic acid-binding protein
MKDKFFVDSNIWIYQILKDNKKESEIKKEISKSFLEKAGIIFISSQVLNEISNVLIKKFEFSPEKVSSFLNEIMQSTFFITSSPKTTFKAHEIHAKYSFSFYDSMIISSSLEAGCDCLITEDLHQGQLIEGSLKIINPFNSEIF